MAKLTVTSTSRRDGRPIGTVLAIMDDTRGFGTDERLANGFLRVQVVGKDRLEKELAKYLNRFEIKTGTDGTEDDWSRATTVNGKFMLRARRITPAFTEILKTRALLDPDQVATATLWEMVDNRQTDEVPAIHVLKSPRQNDAAVKSKLKDTLGPRP